jgi:hypothetical protein
MGVLYGLEKILYLLQTGGGDFVSEVTLSKKSENT